MATHIGRNSAKFLNWVQHVADKLKNLSSRGIRERMSKLNTRQKISLFLGVTYRQTKCVHAILPAFMTVHAFSIPGFSKSEETKKKETPAETPTKQDAASKVISIADQLYSQNEISRLYDYLLEYKDQENDEILWRLARAAVDKGKHSSDDNEKRKLYFEAFDYIKKALVLNEKSSPVHKWYAILLDYTGEYEGNKQRISNAFQVKTHFLKAIELNPQDATSIHSLGYWCFIFADMSWYRKKIASAVFATPPTSSYEEALKYFLQAEETDPNFYSTNLLMLGKTYLRMKNNKMALIYLQRAKDLPVKTPDDRNEMYQYTSERLTKCPNLAHAEAVQLLKSLGATDADSVADR